MSHEARYHATEAGETSRPGCARLGDPKRDLSYSGSRYNSLSGITNNPERSFSTVCRTISMLMTKGAWINPSLTAITSGHRFSVVSTRAESRIIRRSIPILPSREHSPPLHRTCDAEAIGQIDGRIQLHPAIFIPSGARVNRIGPAPHIPYRVAPGMRTSVLARCR